MQTVLHCLAVRVNQVDEAIDRAEQKIVDYGEGVMKHLYEGR